jgi:ribosomal protein L3 glutamine methyltransferase
MDTDNALAATETAIELIDAVAASLTAANLYFGHGTDNPTDEAAALVFHVMSLDHAGAADQYQEMVSAEHRQAAADLLRQRIASRRPLAYLLREAWFCGLPFMVDERVLIPRSPIAELIAEQFQPWLDSAAVRDVLEIGTGSGCIAIAAALAFPDARVTATDISSDALAVAAANVERHGVSDRVRLVRTDHAYGLTDKFDLIVSNPPYVPQSEMAELPAEYTHEPPLGLVSGGDGLDSARRILQDAPKLMRPGAILVLEVGAQWQALEQAFPALPFTWLEFEYGGTGVALLHADDLGVQ